MEELQFLSQGKFCPTRAMCINKKLLRTRLRLFVNGIELMHVPPDAILVDMRLPVGKRNPLDTSIRHGNVRMTIPYHFQGRFIISDKVLASWRLLTWPGIPTI